MRVTQLIILVVAILVGSPAGRSAQCGGEERWSVKVGGDARASQVDVANPVHISLHDLVKVKRPATIGADSPRTDSELKVYIVEARLLKFKRETGKTGDDDYHVVITDDTLQFSPGGPHTTPSPHSVIAEVINPDCVAGRKGTEPTPSLFAAKLATVRQRFEAQFPNMVSSWNEADGTPVRITAVGFFDRPHDQVGRALNGIELHPILDLEFLSPTGPSTASPIVQNPGFEDGDANWVASEGVITNDAREPAKTGKFKAWLGGTGKPHTDTLSQEITIPSDLHAASLAFSLHVTTEEEKPQAFDKLTVQLRRANGTIVTTLATFSNLDARPGFQLKSFDVTPFKGQKVRIFFSAKEDEGSTTSFVIDDVKLAIE
jgi:hypothetical protein